METYGQDILRLMEAAYRPKSAQVGKEILYHTIKVTYTTTKRGMMVRIIPTKIGVKE